MHRKEYLKIGFLVLAKGSEILTFLGLLGKKSKLLCDIIT